MTKSESKPFVIRASSLIRISGFVIRFLAEKPSHAVDGQIPLLEQLGEEKVKHDNGDEAGDEAFGARAADAGRAAAAGKTFVAADQPDRAAEEKALVHALH